MTAKMKEKKAKKSKFMLWNLQEGPDGCEIAELVNAKVITPEEAREICFTLIEQKNEKINI